MLRFTSCLIGTVVLHAYHLRLEEYHHLFLGVTVFSILFHSTQLAIARVIDKCLSHAAFLFILCQSRAVVRMGHPWLFFFPASVLICWFGQSFAPDRRTQLHVLLHISSIAGLHCYMHALHGGGFKDFVNSHSTSH